MTETDTLSTKKRRLITALATTPTVRAAAEAAGIAEVTAWRYLRDDGVRAELAKRQDAMLAQVTGGIVADMAKARAVLLVTMADKSVAPGVRVRAATAVLDYGMRLFEVMALADRVSELERKLSNGNERKATDTKD